MNRNVWNVTYDIFTQESLEYGDSEESGFVLEDGSLREAIAEVFRTESLHCERLDVCADCSDPATACWLRVCNGADWQDGRIEDRSLHFPDSTTGASRSRLVRLLGG